MEAKRKNYMTLAEGFYHEGDLLKAINMYMKALLFGSSVEDECLILFNLGAIHLELGHLDQAKLYNQRIIELDDSLRDPYYQLGVIYEEEGDLEEASDNYIKAILLDQDDVDSRYNLALIYERLGNSDEMVRLYNEILKLDPNHYYTLNNLGSLQESNGRYYDAKAYLERSIKENPDFYLSRFNMGVVLKGLGDLEGAIEEYDISKMLKPDFGNAYLNISAIRIEQGKLDYAVSVLTEGIANSPLSHDLYYNRACCLSRLGRITESIRDLDDALRLNPYLVVWVKRDSDFEPLKNNTEFIKLIDEALEAIQKGR